MEKVAVYEEMIWEDILEKEAGFAEFKAKRAKKKKQRQEQFDKTMKMCREEIQPIEDQYNAGKIDYETYYQKLNDVAKRNGEGVFVSQRQPGKEWLGPQINRTI